LTGRLPEWVDWFNHPRLYQACVNIPPAEVENSHAALAEAGRATA
jgi:putative transposase